MKAMLRGLAVVAVPVLLATSTSLLPPPPPLMVVAAGPGQAPVVAVATVARVRAPAARTAAVIAVFAGATRAENDARVGAIRYALRAAAPDAEIATQAFPTTNGAPDLNLLGPSPIGGRVVAVFAGSTSTARRLVVGAIRTFPFARFDGVENEPADCSAAHAAAEAKGRAAGRALADAAANALGWEVGAETASEDRHVEDTVPGGSRYCRGGEALLSYPLDGAIADDRSTLIDGRAFAFRARERSTRPVQHVDGDVAFEPGYPLQFPGDVELVVRRRALTFVGAASAPIAYAGDFVTYISNSSDDALRDRVRALGLTDVRMLATRSGEPVLVVRVPRDGPVQADAVVRLMRAAAGGGANEVALTPYADCSRRDAELVAAAVHDAQRRARVVDAALHLDLGAPAAVLVTQPAPRSGCRTVDSPLYRDITPAASVVHGAPDRFTDQTVVVAVTYPTQPAVPLPGAVATTAAAAEERYEPRPDDVTPRVRPVSGVEHAKKTAVRTLAARRIDLEISDAPDAANNFRAVDPAAVEKAVAPWIAGVPSTRTHVTVQPSSWKLEHRADVTIGYRLDGVPPGFTEQSRITEAVKRLGALGYPTLQYVPRAIDCGAASDAATIEAVRGALAGGATPSAIVAGPAVVRHGGCVNGAGVQSPAWSNQGVDATVRIEVTARVFR